MIDIEITRLARRAAVMNVFLTLGGPSALLDSVVTPVIEQAQRVLVLTHGLDQELSPIQETVGPATAALLADPGAPLSTEEARQLAPYLAEAQLHTESPSFYEVLLRSFADQLGTDHPDHSGILRSIAVLRGEAGDAR